MSKPDEIPQDVWDSAVLFSGVYAEPAGETLTDLRMDFARAIIAERERCATAGRSAVMKFRGKVGGRYYAGYHEDMRDAVAAAIRDGNEK